MNEYEKEKYKKNRIYRERIETIAKSLGWKFDLIDAEKYPLSERLLIVLHNKARIVINFGYPYCKPNYRKNLQVKASLNILNNHIRSIGFSLKRSTDSLVKDIKSRLIFDLEQKYKKLYSQCEERKCSDNIFALRKQSFDTLFKSYDDNTQLEYHNYTHCLNSVSPDIIIESYEGKHYNNVIKVVMAKSSKHVDVIVNSVNEKLAAQIIDLVKKGNKNDL